MKTKIFFVGLIWTLLFVTLFGTAGCSDKQESKKKANSAVITELVETNEIPELVDANLIACIHAHPLYDGTEDSYEDIEGLDCSSMNIMNLTGIQRVPNLSILNLSDNPITSVIALSSLTELERLYLGGTNITDITPLVKLIQLQVLVLSDTFITDISPVKALVNLIDLTLYDMSPLSCSGLDTVKESLGEFVFDPPYSELQNECVSP